MGFSASVLEPSLGLTTHARNRNAVFTSGEFPNVVARCIDLPFGGTLLGA